MTMRVASIALASPQNVGFASKFKAPRVIVKEKGLPAEHVSVKQGGGKDTDVPDKGKDNPTN